MIVPNRLYAALAGVVFLIGMVSAAFLYFKYSQKRMEQLALEAQTQAFAVEQQNILIEQLIEDQKRMVILMEAVKEQQEISKRNVTDLEKKFKKQTFYGERDIGFVAENKPELVQKVINSATLKAIQCLEKATGKQYENLDCDN